MKKVTEVFNKSGSAKPPKAILEAPTPGPQEKNGLFLLHDGEAATAE